jgi:3-hydroxyacyl-[acyl-carrier-protein] dehydratase
MRYQLVDRILHYDPGKALSGSKQTSIEANNLVPFAPNRLIYPATLGVEAIAQLGGLLVSASFNFDLGVVLAMISSVGIKGIIKTGSELMITVKAREISREAAVIDGKITIGEELVLSAERIVYGLIELRDEPSKKQLGNLFDALREPGFGQYPAG